LCRVADIGGRSCGGEPCRLAHASSTSSRNMYRTPQTQLPVHCPANSARARQRERSYGGWGEYRYMIHGQVNSALVRSERTCMYTIANESCPPKVTASVRFASPAITMMERIRFSAAPAKHPSVNIPPIERVCVHMMKSFGTVWGCHSCTATKLGYCAWVGTGPQAQSTGNDGHWMRQRRRRARPRGRLPVGPWRRAARCCKSWPR
jgi:hypothetical protein